MNKRAEGATTPHDSGPETRARFRRLTQSVGPKLKALTYGEMSQSEIEALESELSDSPYSQEVMASFVPLTEAECERIFCKLPPSPLEHHQRRRGLPRSGLALAAGVAAAGLATAARGATAARFTELARLAVATIRLPVVLVSTSVVSLLLFQFMYLLISVAEPTSEQRRLTIELEKPQPHPGQSLELYRQALPERSAPKAPPSVPKTLLPPTPKLKKLFVPVKEPAIEAKLELSKIVVKPLRSLSRRKADTPVVRVEPQYPSSARKNLIEGWVTIQFDIKPDGSTTNVTVLDSKPKTIFDDAARTAVRGWKYRPRTIRGDTQTVRGQTARLQFRLLPE